ncbi:MAG: hypothetical protein JNK31_06250 [Candidatus Competibacter sp.]|nr:hypothetical protein [Candidatus Competibacter sp.]
MEPLTSEADDGAIIGLSYVLKEQEQLARVWSDEDRADHERAFRENGERAGAIRQSIEGLRAGADSVWERFVTLTLERLLSEKLREFLDEIDSEIVALSQQMVEADCEIDRLRARVQERQRGLEDKIALLEPMAHRTSTQTHLNMMLARVEGLEAYLLGKKDVAPEAYDLHYKRHTTLPGDLLYIRVRLSTTQVAVAASNRSKQLAELVAEWGNLLLELDRCKAELAVLMNRVDCMSDLSRYWVAYLDVARDKPA